METTRRLANGRYILQTPLGKGGMASVFHGWDTVLEVQRAIKLLSGDLTRSAQVRQRFLNEARTMAKLSHPNVVPVFDVGEDGADVFLVMELMPGGSVADHIDRFGPMEPVQACDVGLQVVEALVAAHGLCVVHRDLKPPNLLIDARGTVRLSDFGVARDPGRPLTSTGMLMGTWGYMAPEQRVSAKHVDTRADLYALGATLAAMLTAREPDELHNPETHAEALSGIPAPLREVVVGCTRYSPEERFPDAISVRDAIREARDEITEVAAPALGSARTGSTGLGTADPIPVDSRTFLMQGPSAGSVQESSRSPGRLALLGAGMLLSVAGVASLVVVALAGNWGSCVRAEPEVAVPDPLAAHPPPERVAPPAPSPGPANAPVPERSSLRAIPPEPTVPVPAVAPEPTSPEPAAAVTKGTLFVNALPPGLVLLDGADAGSTPVELALPVGAHTLEIRRGDDAWSTAVRIEEARRTEACWDFANDAPCKGGM